MKAFEEVLQDAGFRRAGAVAEVLTTLQAYGLTAVQAEEAVHDMQCRGLVFMVSDAMLKIMSNHSPHKVELAIPEVPEVPEFEPPAVSRDEIREIFGK